MYSLLQESVLYKLQVLNTESKPTWNEFKQAQIQKWIFLGTPYRKKLFGDTPEKEWLHLIGYLEQPVVPNNQLIGALGGSEKAN